MPISVPTFLIDTRTQTNESEMWVRKGRGKERVGEQTPRKINADYGLALLDVC